MSATPPDPGLTRLIAILGTCKDQHVAAVLSSLQNLKLARELAGDCISRLDLDSPNHSRASEFICTCDEALRRAESELHRAVLDLNDALIALQPPPLKSR